MRGRALRIAGALGGAAVAVGCSLVIKDPLSVLAREHRGAPAVTFSRAEAIEELDTLARLLDRVHADPYRFHSRDIVEAERRRLTDTMPASLSQTELCLRLSRLLATLDDGHSSMSCDVLVIQEWRRAAKASPPDTQKVRMFQPAMRLDDRNHLIVRWPNYAAGIEPGDRLLRVNGQDADALLASWARETSHDTEAGRLATVARRFRLQLELHGISAPYQVTVAAPGGPTRDVTVQGDPVNYQFQDRPTPAPPPNTASPQTPRSAPVAEPVEIKTPFFNYRMMRPGVAYMDFFSLVGDSLLSAESSFKKSVAAMFRQVAVDKPRVLIIDVRENGGGEDSMAVELLRRLTEKPFRLLASTRFKRSRDVRDAGKKVLRIPFAGWVCRCSSTKGVGTISGKRARCRPAQTADPHVAARGTILRRPGVRADRPSHVFGGDRIRGSSQGLRPGDHRRRGNRRTTECVRE
jgi:hypothetical protein